MRTLLIYLSLFFLSIASIHAQSMKKMDTMKEWIEFTQVYTDRIHQMEKEEKFTKGKTALLTMHGAKGLEYRCVYIIEAQEGSIPHRKAIVEEEIEEEAPTILPF